MVLTNDRAVALLSRAFVYSYWAPMQWPQIEDISVFCKSKNSASHSGGAVVLLSPEAPASSEIRTSISPDS